MAQRWVTVAAYATPEEAHLACNALHAEGLPAVVDDDVIVGLAWHLGGALGGVKVKVPVAHVTAAREFLGTGEEPGSAADDDESNSAQRRASSRVCPSCGERAQAGFDLCWKCGAEVVPIEQRPGTRADDLEVPLAAPSNLPDDVSRGAAEARDDARIHEEEDEDAHDDDSTTDAADPTRAPLSAAQLTDRAWKAAVIGCLVCPGFLQAYSIWCLLRAAAIDDLDDRTSAWKWYAALALNLSVLAYVAIVLRIILNWGLPVDYFL